jgi:hypothetical protein
MLKWFDNHSGSFHFSYNGDIVDDFEIDQATHIVVNNEDPVKTTNKKARHVNLDDLWTCIKMRLKLDSI